jgi:hypothetical protein
MTPPAVVRLVAVAAALLGFVASAANDDAIDWARARGLHQKQQRGATLTPEENAYLERAIAARGGNAAAAAAPAPRDHTGLVPLTEMTGDQRYKGRDGGLYGGGRNDPPPAHRAAALAAAASVVPLDASGHPAADGKIVLLSVGMSNTTQEFSRFIELAERDPARSPRVVLVDGAQGGQTAAAWARASDSPIWRTVDARLRAAHVTPAQVEVVWLKQANARPTEPFPAHAEKLAADLATIATLLHEKFPHLRIAYLSSRIYGGYATSPLNPEPYAYEGAFAVRDVIRRQIDGDTALNFDPAKAAVRAPLLLWGPYLWADGLTPRKADGLVWKREDVREDGTHPSATTGRTKVAEQLLTFLKTDPTAKTWFAR